MELRNKVIYRHLKPCGETFYIGIGNEKRPYSKSDRSDFWKKVVDKYGYEIDILKTNLTLKEAYELEILLVSWYGRKNLNKGPLVNLTDGGDGSNNVVVSEITREKLRKARLNYKHPEEVKLKMSNSHKGKILPIETRKKMSDSAKVKIFTKKHRLNLSKVTKGENNPMYGKSHTEESKDKMANKARNRIMSQETKDKLSKIILDLNTGIYYIGLTEAAIILNISKKKLGRILNGEYINNTSLIYV